MLLKIRWKYLKWFENDLESLSSFKKWTNAFNKFQERLEIDMRAFRMRKKVFKTIEKHHNGPEHFREWVESF